MHKSLKERLVAKLAKQKEGEKEKTLEAASKALEAYNTNVNKYLRDGREEDLQSATLQAVLYEGLINKINQISGQAPLSSFQVLQNAVPRDADQKKIFKLSVGIMRSLIVRIGRDEWARLLHCSRWIMTVYRVISSDTSAETKEIMFQTAVEVRDCCFTNSLSNSNTTHLLNVMEVMSEYLAKNGAHDKLLMLLKDHFDILNRKMEMAKEFDKKGYNMAISRIYYNLAFAAMSSSHLRPTYLEFAILIIRKFNEVQKTGHYSKSSWEIEFKALFRLGRFKEVEDLSQRVDEKTKQKMQYVCHVAQREVRAAKELSKNIVWDSEDDVFLGTLHNHFISCRREDGLKRVVDIAMQANIGVDKINNMQIKYFIIFGAYEAAYTLLANHGYQGIGPALAAEVFYYVGQLDRALELIAEDESIIGKDINRNFFIKFGALFQLQRYEDLKKEFLPYLDDITDENIRCQSIRTFIYVLFELKDIENLKKLIKEKLPQTENCYLKLRLLLFVEENEECMRVLSEMIANAPEGHELYGLDLSQYSLGQIAECIMKDSFEEIYLIPQDIEVDIKGRFKIEEMMHKASESYKEDSVTTWFLPNGISIKSSDPHVVYNDRLQKYFYLTEEPDDDYKQAVQGNGKNLMHRIDHNYMNVRPGGSGSDRRALALRVGDDLFVVGAYGSHKDIERLGRSLPTPEQFVDHYVGKFEGFLREEDKSQARKSRGAAAALIVS